MKKPAKKPPYRICWECGRKFQGPFYRMVETTIEGITLIVYVHACCVEAVIADHGGKEIT